MQDRLRDISLQFRSDPAQAAPLLASNVNCSHSSNIATVGKKQEKMRCKERFGKWKIFADNNPHLEVIQLDRYLDSSWKLSIFIIHIRQKTSEMEQIKINRVRKHCYWKKNIFNQLFTVERELHCVVLQYCSTLIYFNEMDSFLFESLIEIWLVTPQ